MQNIVVKDIQARIDISNGLPKERKKERKKKRTKEGKKERKKEKK